MQLGSSAETVEVVDGYESLGIGNPNTLELRSIVIYMMLGLLVCFRSNSAIKGYWAVWECEGVPQLSYGREEGPQLESAISSLTSTLFSCLGCKLNDLSF